MIGLYNEAFHAVLIISRKMKTKKTVPKTQNFNYFLTREIFKIEYDLKIRSRRKYEKTRENYYKLHTIFVSNV